MSPKLIFLITLSVPLAGAFLRPENRTVAVARPQIDSLYIVLSSGGLEMPEKAVFTKAVSAFQSVPGKRGGSSGIVSIIDFTKPSNEKRFWIIDLDRGKVLHHMLVAHGKNSGDLYAREFSNLVDSRQSSLGLFITGKTYIGKHGLSLKLHGLEPGINDMAEKRAIVIHAADYVSEGFVKKYGRLGRSFGCPAIPVENHKEIINTLANGSCLYIHHS